MATFEEAIAAAEKEVTDTESLVAFIVGLKAALQDALSQVGKLTPAQQAALDSVFDKATANDQAVVDALAANVP